MQRPRALTIPDLPDFDVATAMTLREAIAGGHVPAPPGRKTLQPEQLSRWCRKGVVVLRGGPKYRFPAYRGSKELLTTPAWCKAWFDFRARVQAEDARRQATIGLPRAA
jgi:hypothetical protein